MPSTATVTATVTVPATTANIGPGFDCLGAALTLHNRFKISPLYTTVDALKINVAGPEAERVPLDEKNLIYQAFARFYHHLNQTPPPIHIEIELGVPLARGLGSSSTAIVGGLMAANLLAGSPLDQSALIDLAIAIEGHPDNVVPAFRGGCCLAASGTDVDWVISDIPWHEAVIPVVAIPNFELSTADARQVLPQSYSRADAIFNTSHLGLLLRGLATAREEWLKAALGGRIHQPYRQTLIPGYEAVCAAAIQSGAYGIVISGAGPTLLALADREDADAIANAMVTTWAESDVQAKAMPLSIDCQGAVGTIDEEDSIF